MLSTLKGLPIAYELVSANTDERKAVEGVLEAVRHFDIYGDKGFIGQDWQEEIASSTGNQIWTIVGFTTHMAAKIASHTLRLLFRLQFGIDVQTFQSTTAS